MSRLNPSVILVAIAMSAALYLGHAAEQPRETLVVQRSVK